MERRKPNKPMPEKSGMDIHANPSLSEEPSALAQNTSGGSGEVGDFGESDSVELPTFFDRVCGMLPGIMQEVADAGESPQEIDALLLGAIAVISSCLPGVHGRYDGVTVFPNLLFFLTARAASGKGRIDLCRLLIRPIHQRLKNQQSQALAKYKADLAKWEVAGANRGPKPQKPPLTMLIIPANSSATAVYQLLGDNHGKGLIFETLWPMPSNPIMGTSATVFGRRFIMSAFRITVAPATKTWRLKNLSYPQFFPVLRDRFFHLSRTPKTACFPVSCSTALRQS